VHGHRTVEILNVTGSMGDTSTLIQEIVKRCEQQGKDCIEPLAAYIAGTTLLNKNQGSSDLEQPDIFENVVTSSVQCIVELDSPVVETLKMQVLFENSQRNMEQLVCDRSRTTSLPECELFWSITRQTLSESTEYKKLHRDIFLLLMKFFAGQMPVEKYTKDIRCAVEKEVAAAMETVFPEIGLRSFMPLSPTSKSSQLEELSNIVMGIRLFNKAAGKGGAGMEACDKTCANSIRCIKDFELETEVEDAGRNCIHYQGVIGRCPDSLNDPYMIKLKDELLNRRQYFNFVQFVHSEANHLTKSFSETQESYSVALEDLRCMIGSRTSVPKESVYPRFEQIARLWVEMSKQSIWAEGIIFMTRVLKQFKQPNANPLEKSGGCIDSINKEGEKEGICTSNLSKRYNELEKSSLKYSREEESPVLITADDTPNFMHITLAYQGYCSWNVVCNSGLVIPGDPSLGLVHFRGKNYAFASSKAMDSFYETPLLFLQSVEKLAMQKTSLVYLLNIQHCFPQVGDLLTFHEGRWGPDFSENPQKVS